MRESYYMEILILGFSPLDIPDGPFDVAQEITPPLALACLLKNSISGHSGFDSI